MNTRMSFIGGLLLLALCRTPADAARTEQWLTSEDLTAYAPGDEALGDYVYLAFDVPSGVTDADLLSATLEIYFDVDIRPVSLNVNDQTVEVDAPISTLQVFPLTANWSDELNTDTLDHEGSIKVPVRLGENRLVRIDITRVVRSFLRNPSSNRGLVVGSLTDSRLGLFSVQDTFGAGKKARIVYVH